MGYDLYHTAFVTGVSSSESIWYSLIGLAYCRVDHETMISFYQLEILVPAHKLLCTCKNNARIHEKIIKVQ